MRFLAGYPDVEIKNIAELIFDLRKLVGEQCLFSQSYEIVKDNSCVRGKNTLLCEVS